MRQFALALLVAAPLSARETGTVNGGMSIDFPVTIWGNIGRRITTTLGSGGPRIRAVTTNGAVRIRER